MSDHVLHQVAHVGLDDEDHLRKARAQRVENGVFHQYLAVRADAVHLLVAAVARAHARRHNDQRCFHKTKLLSKFSITFSPNCTPRVQSSPIIAYPKRHCNRLFPLLSFATKLIYWRDYFPTSRCIFMESFLHAVASVTIILLLTATGYFCAAHGLDGPAGQAPLSASSRCLSPSPACRSTG